MPNYYNQVTPMVGTTVSKASYSQPTYYSPPANNNYYAPSYQTYPSYTYVPTYQQQGYQQPSAPSVPTQPRQSVPTVTTQKAGTPIIQGKNVSYQKVSDLGAIGDHKTVQMPDGSYRDYVRTGTNTYQYTEIRAADKATVTAKSNAKGVVQVTKVTPSVSTPASSSLSTRPLVLYEIPNAQSISTTDIPKVNDVTQVDKPDGGYISYKRISPTQIQYQEYSKAGQITTPWTSIYEDTPTVAPAAKLTPAVTSPPVTPKASEFIAAPLIGTKTQIASSSKADKPDFSVLRIKSASEILPGGAPTGEGEGKEGSDDESAEEPEGEEGKSKDDGKFSEDETSWWKGEEGFIPDEVEEAVTPVTEYAKLKTGSLTQSFENLVNPSKDKDVKLPDREEGVVGGGVKDPVSPSTEIPGSPTAGTPVYGAQIPRGGVFPAGFDPVEAAVNTEKLGGVKSSFASDEIQSDEQASEKGEQDRVVKTRILSYLNGKYSRGEKNGWNERLSNSFPWLAFDVYLGKTTYDNAVWWSEYIETVHLGTESFSIADGVKKASGSASYSNETSWVDASLDQRIEKLQKIVGFGLSHGISSDVITNVVGDYINNQTPDDQKQELSNASQSSAFNIGVAQYWATDPLGYIFGAATSDQGSKAIGTVTAGVLAVSGLGAGAAGFAYMEVTNYRGMSGSGDKTRLQNMGLYGPELDDDAGRVYNDLVKAYENLSMKSSGMSAEDIKKAKADIVSRIGNAKKVIDSKDLALMANGTYFTRMQDLNSLLGTVNLFEGKVVVVNPETGLPQEVTPQEAIKLEKFGAGVPVTITGPSDLRYKNVETGEWIDGDLTKTQKLGRFVVEAYRGDKLIGQGAVNIQDPDAPYQISFSAAGYGMAEPERAGYVKFTDLDPDAKVFINGKEVRTEGLVGYTAQPGKSETIVVTVKKEGYNDKIQTIKLYDGINNSVPLVVGSAAWKPSVGGSAGSSDNYEGFIAPLYEGQKIYINGLEANKYLSEDNYLAVPYGAGKYDVRIVNPDGSTAYHNPDEYVSDGKMTALPLTMGEDPKAPYQKQSYSGGGGGGGGSSGGGGGGGSSYQPPPEPETLIIYGPTCKDAEIWQDEVQVYPEIDEPYSISPGYHSIKAERVGFKPWLKTVYCASGDSITVSPAFEPVEGSGEPTEPVDSTFPKRVFINSDPSGALVLVNGSSSGEWTPCYLDLPEGYYTFTIKKSGYDPYDIVCYVGEVIAWNQQAVELATSRGWI